MILKGGAKEFALAIESLTRVTGVFHQGNLLSQQAGDMLNVGIPPLAGFEEQRMIPIDIHHCPLH